MQPVPWCLQVADHAATLDEFSGRALTDNHFNCAFGDGRQCLVDTLQPAILFLVAANQRRGRAIMGENGGGAGRFVRVSPRAIVLRLTTLRWLATPSGSLARAA